MKHHHIAMVTRLREFPLSLMFFLIEVACNAFTPTKTVVNNTYSVILTTMKENLSPSI